MIARKYAPLVLSVVVFLISMFIVSSVYARSAKVVRQFRAIYSCPSTGKYKGACPGYVVDHPEPLCTGGADTVENMRWQEVRESYKKDVEERRLCRKLKKERGI